MVPTFDLYLQPFLETLKGGEEKSLKQISEELAVFFKLTDDDLQEMIAKGGQSKHYNRVSWSGTYSLKAGLTRRPKPGCYQITDFGKEFMKKWNPINLAVLRAEIPEFAEFAKTKPKDPKPKGEESPSAEEKTPTERMDEAFSTIHDALVEDLLTKLHTVAP